MKGKLIIGSIGIIFLLILVPATSAIQIQTLEKATATQDYSKDMITRADVSTLLVFLKILVKDHPALSQEFPQQIKEIETAQLPTPLTSHRVSDNQTMLEKIYWKIFNYRVFRLYVSAMLFIYFQSNLTLMRTVSWGIKLLRWVNIGILLGYITTTSTPQQPMIGFEQDNGNKTLTVTSVAPSNILWSAIDQIGSGTCDPLPAGNVTVGDEITNCAGIIVLRYLPLNEILGVFEFD